MREAGIGVGHPRTLCDWRRLSKSFRRDRPLRMQCLELRQSLMGVPTVLSETHVRKLVVQRRDLLELQDKRLLLVRLHTR